MGEGSEMPLVRRAGELVDCRVHLSKSSTGWLTDTMRVKRTPPQGEPAEPDPRILQEILGYLNFSGGKPDAAFQRNWNTLFADPNRPQAREAQGVKHLLLEHLGRL